MTEDRPPVLRAQGLRQTYAVRRGWLQGTQQLQAVGGVSFVLPAGRTLAVVGESGCGKSTLARMAALIEAPSDGQLWVQGINPAQASAAQQSGLRRSVQMVFQNPFGSLNPRHTIGTSLAAPLRVNTAFSSAECAEQAQQMLERVGLRPEHAQRYPHMFSGGQRQRIAIARALMLQPALLVADEPVSALDVSVQAQVLNLLADLQQHMQLAYLFISHDLGVVRHVAHEVLVMYLGHTVEHGPKDALFAQPLHPYTQALLSATPGLAARAGGHQRIVLQGELPSPLNPPPGCVFSTRCPHATAQCRAERPVLRELLGRQVACHEAERLGPAPTD